MQILIATDADWIVDEITSALGDDGVTFIVCRDGRVVADQVDEHEPDLAVLDLQIGSMGGMAVTMSLRLDESAGTLPARAGADAARPARRLHLARRSGAEGWLIKPLDALRLKRAATALIAGGTYTEGAARAGRRPSRADADAEVATTRDDATSELAEEEPATAG